MTRNKQSGTESGAHDILFMTCMMMFHATLPLSSPGHGRRWSGVTSRTMETALSRLAANYTVRQSMFYHNQLINPSASTLCWVDKPQQPQGLAPPASRRLPSVSLSGYRCSLLGSREQESNFPPTAIDSPLHSLNIKLSAPPLGFLPALLCTYNIILNFKVYTR